jgi:hypothetical protein
LGSQTAKLRAMAEDGAGLADTLDKEIASSQGKKKAVLF